MLHPCHGILLAEIANNLFFREGQELSIMAAISRKSQNNNFSHEGKKHRQGLDS